MTLICQQTSILLWICSFQIDLVASLQVKSFALSRLRLLVALQCRTGHFRSWVSVFRGVLICKEVAFIKYFFSDTHISFTILCQPGPTSFCIVNELILWTDIQTILRFLDSFDRWWSTALCKETYRYISSLLDDKPYERERKIADLSFLVFLGVDNARFLFLLPGVKISNGWKKNLEKVKWYCWSTNLRFCSVTFSYFQLHTLSLLGQSILLDLCPSCTHSLESIIPYHSVTYRMRKVLKHACSMHEINFSKLSSKIVACEFLPSKLTQTFASNLIGIKANHE